MCTIPKAMQDYRDRHPIQVLNSMNPSRENQPVYSVHQDPQSASEILVIIDSGVEQAEVLLQGMIPPAQAVILNPDQDGVTQITQLLKQNPTVSSLHIISHGSPGSLQLGNSQLSLDTLRKYAEQLQNWFKVPLSKGDLGGSLLLYGCNVAAGDAGTEFIEKLHRLTGAEIAASATRTGNSSLGGDWQLEVTTHDFVAELAVTPAVQESYSGVFPAAIDDIAVVGNTDGEDNSYTLNGIDYTFKVEVDGANNLQIQSFTLAGGEEYLAGEILNNFELRRVDNAAVTGERQLIWFEQAPGSTETDVQLRPSFVNTMEEALFGDIVNRGTDNLFDNFDNDQGNFNNIERVDYISTAGLTVPVVPANQGFLILERNGNDPFNIAAITALDANGDPSTFGNLVSPD
jgi:hypothetical protein